MKNIKMKLDVILGLIADLVVYVAEREKVIDVRDTFKLYDFTSQDKQKNKTDLDKE